MATPRPSARLVAYHPRGRTTTDVAAAVVVLPLGWYAARRATGRRVAMFRAVILVALIDVLLLIFSGPVV